MTQVTTNFKSPHGGKKKPTTYAEKCHMNACHKVPCVICTHYGMKQTSPTQAHHWIMGRGQQTRTPNDEAIAICEGHHQGFIDTSKVAVHKEPKLWREMYGRD